MLFGKTIVITGVASGIGLRSAELAASMGADVYGIDVVEPKSIKGHFIKGDLSTEEGVNSIVSQLPDQIDALCNVAGVSGTGGINITLAINVYGLKHLSEKLADKIRTGGSIVNVASFAGFGWRENHKRAAALAKQKGFPDIAALVKEFNLPEELGYPISKEILIVWTMLASHDALFKAKNIRVNAVSPGPVETPILTQFREVLGDERVNEDVERVGRAGNASDIAPVIMFLCSEASRWINGHNLATDGGLETSATIDLLKLK